MVSRKSAGFLGGDGCMTDILAELEARRAIARQGGGSRLDVARATGFLHAQERFFQMHFDSRGLI